MPVRLTYNPARDLAPRWLPNGSTVSYSTTVIGTTRAGSLCLTEIPATGGRRTRTRCAAADPLGDSVTAIFEAAYGPSGRMAWLETATIRGGLNTGRGGLYLGSMNLHEVTTRVMKFPYVSASGRLHNTATHLHWLDRWHLIYVAADVIPSRADTMVVGQEIAIIDIRQPNHPFLVPGTAFPTSVWPIDEGRSILYTVMGDSRVFQLALPDGAPTVAHDFAGGIARDVTEAGDRLLALVGGHVQYFVHPQFGPLQIDSGGAMVLLNKASGNETAVPFVLLDDPDNPDGERARRPVISPDGHAAAFEALHGRDVDVWATVIP